MGAGHGHVSGAAAGPLQRQLLALVLVPVAVATLVGLIALRPPGARRQIPPQFRSAPTRYVAGTVVSLAQGSCSVATTQETGEQVSPGPQCLVVTVRLAVGTTDVQLSPGTTSLHVEPGDAVRLGTVDGASYYIADLARGRPLALLALLGALVVVAVAGRRGVTALVALVVAGGVLVLFVLPALLAGTSPVAVALVGSSAILFPALLVAHGPSARTCTALVGTLGGLLLVTGLGAAAVRLTHLTGLSDENATALRVFDTDLSATGLITCGLVIGALGALNDVTVTQASAVWELDTPTISRRALFASAMRVGRDHIASSVYTLVFAYAGAALPVLLLLSLASRPARDVLTGDLVATELVRTLVGAVALVLAVPVTTAVAVLVAHGQHGGRRRAVTA